MIAEVFDRLFHEIQEVKNTYLLSSSLAPVWRSAPYRELVRLGSDVLPLVINKIREGAFELNSAALEILRTSPEQLTDRRFPSEQDVSAAIVQRFGHMFSATLVR